MATGKLVMLLHAHLPFVRNPEHERFLEENWFFEALSECYIPLLQSLYRMVERGVKGTINLSLSPTLLQMLADPLLQKRYSKHLAELIDLAQREQRRVEHDSHKFALISYYLQRLRSTQYSWEQRYNCNLIPYFLELQDLEKLEILTCVGTHPFLPAYQAEPGVVRFQLELTVKTAQEILGFVPKSLWLPECGYFHGLDSIVREFGFENVFLETHGILGAKPQPPYGVFSPIRSEAGLQFLGRDQNSSREVWSRKVGYPGHPQYREFFRDLVHEAPRDFVGEYFYAGDSPIISGFKYYRITGSEDKEIYQPLQALQLAREHARQFVLNREAQVQDLAPHTEIPPVVFAPYDAELFGHWWFEGPEFIEGVFERAAWSSDIEMVGVSTVMDSTPNMPEANPFLSSWGEGGYGAVWMNSQVDINYKNFYAALAIFRMAYRKHSTGGFSGLVLAQMARELALLQSSDWAFMIHNNSAAEFARNRMDEHYQNFVQLNQLLEEDRTQSRIFDKISARNNAFPYMGPSIYRHLAR